MRRNASARRSVPSPLPATVRLTANRPITDTGTVSGALRLSFPGADVRWTAPTEIE